MKTKIETTLKINILFDVRFSMFSLVLIVHHVLVFYFSCFTDDLEICGQNLASR